MTHHASGDAPHLSDEQIIGLYFGRDEQAISETDRKYGRMLLQVSHGILGDTSDCEECLSDTYIKVWNAIPPTRPQSLRAYLAQIIRRLSINRYRERRTKGRVPSEYTVSLDELAEVLCASDTEVDSHEVGRLLHDFLGTLTAHERTLFVGRYYMARTLESLAEERHETVSKVYRTLGRIKEMLREHLERNGVDV